MQNIDIFPWNENFNTGIKTIDEQHRKLVRILNRLATHVALEADEIVVNSIFDELIDYTIYHFQTEEAIWHKHLPDDPLDIKHQETHKEFATKALQFKK